MILFRKWSCVFFAFSCAMAAQQTKSAPVQKTVSAPSTEEQKLLQVFEPKIKAEWDAFKNRDKKAFADLLADDFMAVEDDNEGMRNKNVAVAEVDRALVSNYSLFALKVLPLDKNAALVTYELTMQFPPRAQVRFKRVLVSEIWIKHNGDWKERYYQETRVR